MLDKKEEHLNKKIEEELKKAKANATSNKRRTSSSYEYIITDTTIQWPQLLSVRRRPSRVNSIE